MAVKEAYLQRVQKRLKKSIWTLIETPPLNLCRIPAATSIAILYSFSSRALCGLWRPKAVTFFLVSRLDNYASIIYLPDKEQ